MGRHRMGLSIALAAGMAATLSGGSAAEDMGATGQVDIVTGSVAGEPFDVTLADWDPATLHMTGLALSVPVESSDPRLTGTMSVASTGSGTLYGDGGVQLVRSTMRLVTDAGVWVGEGWEAEARSDVNDDTAAFHVGSSVLEGEGAYDGLLAYVSIAYDGGVPTIEAVILENTLPPAPPPISGAE
jgi:hypothetical protein